MMKRVEGHQYLYRSESGAIVNTDGAAYRAYMQRKSADEKKEQTVSSLVEDLEAAKKEIEELKELVRLALRNK